MSHSHDHGPAHESPTGADVPAVVAEMTEAARIWLGGLDGGQQRTVLWPFDSAERGDWHYAPRRRNGLALRDMSEAQRLGAYALLATGLSPRGNAKARAIMALETVLKEIEQGRGPLRDPLNYAFTIFGEPGGFPWGWRIEGHHLIVNVTVAGPLAVTITPTFWGTNPARIPHGPRAGERIMAREYHLGLDLAQSLTAAQRKEAVFSSRSVGNIITERGRAQALAVPTGLAFDALAEGQRDLVMALIHEYVGHAVDAVGVPHLERAQQNLGALKVAWAGGMTEGAAFYYRLHAPRLLIEFDCSQNNANHIHTVWRDPVSDWGRDVLGEHYKHHHDQD
jgi:hypothetical protein